ncbi:MAG TPA: flagellar biosynthesis anti-sigma factor FlgM [Steroidobacteraceae bacterium]|nr:flagellar biosynthesis anti-sigma factor FlgM [Steroidobacteraceae bacterium]
MANAIDSFLGNGAASVSTHRSRTPTQGDTSAASAPAASSTGTGSDEVQITSTASQLAGLGSKLSAMPAVDAAKVARISQSIAAGTYTIDADKIAGGLLQSDRALAQIGVGG